MKFHWLEHKRKEAQANADKANLTNRENDEHFWLGYVAALKDVYAQQSRENMSQQRSW